MSDREAIEPRNVAPRPEAAGDLVDTVGADVDQPIGRDQPQAGVEVGIGQRGKAIGQTGRLAGKIFKTIVAIHFLYAGDLRATKGAVAVVDESGFSGMDHFAPMRV